MFQPVAPLVTLSPESVMKQVFLQTPVPSAEPCPVQPSGRCNGTRGVCSRHKPPTSRRPLLHRLIRFHLRHHNDAAASHRCVVPDVAHMPAHAADTRVLLQFVHILVDGTHGSSPETLCSPPRISGSLRYTEWMFCRSFIKSHSMAATLRMVAMLSVWGDSR